MKEEFPILKQGLVYLDTAASAQKPTAVIEAIKQFYEENYSNVHRGMHHLAEQATEMYEGARKSAARFLNSPSEKSIIFTKNTTESINLLASTLPIKKGDKIIITELEHHSNLVPWQQRALKEGATLKFIPHKEGELDMRAAEQTIRQGCTILAVGHVSNVTGSVQDIKKLASLAHEQGSIIVVDGAQAAPHLKIDVQDLDVDAYAFSGHKVYGPTGIGVLYAKEELLKKLPPYQYGGEMINEVKKEVTTWASIPQKFEAGTPPIAQAIGLAAALDFIDSHRDALLEEDAVIRYAFQELKKLPYIKIIGPEKRKALISFTVKDVHPHDVADYLATKNICIRAGHHCTQVLHDTLGLSGTCRASFGIYSTKDDVDKLVKALKQCTEVFHV